MTLDENFLQWEHIGNSFMVHVYVLLALAREKGIKPTPKWLHMKSGISIPTIECCLKRMTEPAPTEPTDSNDPTPDSTPDATPASRFRKPTLEEVREYVREKGYTFDPEGFMDHYESVGWKVGRNPMKNWRSACNQFQRHEERFGRGRKVDVSRIKSVEQSSEW